MSNKPEMTEETKRNIAKKQELRRIELIMIDAMNDFLNDDISKYELRKIITKKYGEHFDRFILRNFQLFSKMNNKLKGRIDDI